MQIQTLLRVDLFFIGLMFLSWPSDLGLAQSAGVDKKSDAAANNALQQLERALGHELQVEWNTDNGTPLFLSGGLTAPQFSASHPSAQVAALSFLRDYSALFQIKEPVTELLLVKSRTDELGMTHLRFQQKYRDLPVWGCELIAHFSKDGAISSINGRYLPSFIISLIPSLTSEAAIDRAQAHLELVFGEDPNVGHANSTSLVIFPKRKNKHLAWLVSLPNRFSPNSKCIVDAITGDVLWIDIGIRN